ncbi:hypothetical protein Acsp05_29890 [Actinokineospora sp. NBRC 105648]|nr:hypothetical protein Acsp05_29890 [Actinokineospora sp. NBRC 105648]
MLVLSDFPSNAGDLVRLAERFGEPEPVFPEAHQVPGHPAVRLQSNVGGLGASAGGRYWHADGPLKPDPTAVTILLCVQPPESAGDTLFADMRAALRALPEPVRARVTGLRGYYPAKDIARQDMDRARVLRTAAISAEERDRKLAELRNLHHPLVRNHPVTGEQALYLNEHWLRSIADIPEHESTTLLRELYGTATAAENVHRHSWTAGDVLVWDNALVMHKAEGAQGRKVTYRVTTGSYA